MEITLRKQNGFTLVELIIVIIVISIVSIFALFRWQGTTINLEAQAQQLAGDIRYTQALSMTKGERYRWVKISSATYQIQNAAGTAMTLAQGNTTVTLNTGITFGALTNLPNNLVAFNGSGTPYTDTGSPGTALATIATIPLTADGETKTIAISSGTGRVIVQ